MANEIAKLWRQHKFSCLSLTLCLGEIVITLVAVVLVHLPVRHNMLLIVKVTTTTWLVGGLCSFLFAVAGLVADSDRMIGVVAIAATIVTFLVCGLQMIV